MLSQKDYSDTNILREVCLLQQTPTMRMTLSQTSLDETCCFLKRLVFFKQQLCDIVYAVYMRAVHASDLHKQNDEYIPAPNPQNIHAASCGC